MSEPEDCDNESCSAPEEPDFKTSLKQFQELVEKTATQKKKERLGLYVKDDVASLLVICITSYICIMEHVINLSSVHDKRIFGYFIGGNGAMSSDLRGESKVFLMSEKQQITYPVVKERDTITSVVKVPHLDFTITSSQKGVLTIFNNKMKVLATTNIKDTAWINGCDFLTQLKCVVAVTERTIVVWDYNSIGEKNYFIIKPMENNLLCVCSATTSDQLAEDNILMGDDKGYVNLLKVTSDHFELEQYSIHSFVLDDVKRLEDNLPVKEFSVPRGVNAFTYCGKAEVIVTGGHDKLLRLWNPNVNTRPTGKLSGHLHSIVEIVTNEKDQHVISLSSAKVWDLQTGYQIYQIEDAHGLNIEVTCAAIETNGFYLATGACDDIQLPSDTSSLSNNAEIFVPSVKMKCFDVIKGEGCSLITTGSENGAIILWDFESASIRYMYKINENSQASVPQACGVNAVLFLPHNASSSRKTSSLSYTTVANSDIDIDNDISDLPEYQNSYLNQNKQIKEKLCWTAHSAEVIDLFHEEQKNVVVTASLDGSVRSSVEYTRDIHSNWIPNGDRAQWRTESRQINIMFTLRQAVYQIP
ncbi:UNVERIFIED_CONTAM: hypothetical protein H355_013723 [Colinus virginianus]|nr:hypothetical protein H355_013723 [Colinus virginianus]